MNHREQFIEVALELFSKRGFPGVSVRDICGELGLKESALYYHFRNKEAILDVLFQRVDDLIERMRERFGHAFAAAERVQICEMQAVAKNFLMKYYCDGNVRRLIAMLNIERMSNPVANGKYLRLMYELPLEQCINVFTEMVKREMIGNVSPDLLAKEYLGIITIAFDRHVTGAADIERGIRAACDDVEREIGLFCEGIINEY